ncbi:MAG: hypothetical protein LKE45_04475 [Olsenella sp.]|jgi:hypothetical protein|nr:hypothetical protein [Olsenella sp.]
MKNSGVGVGLPDAGRANIRVEGGRAVIYSATSDIGQGCNTVFQQDVAEATGLPKCCHRERRVLHRGRARLRHHLGFAPDRHHRRGRAWRAAFLLRDAMLAVERGQAAPCRSCPFAPTATASHRRVRRRDTPYVDNHPSDLTAGHAVVPHDPVAALAVLEGHEFRYVYFEPTDKLGADKPNPKSHVCYAYAATCVMSSTRTAA